MKNMKKALVLLLSLSMVLGMLAACGSKTPASSQAPTTGGKPGEGKTVALVCDQIGNNPFLVPMVNAINDKAEEYGFTAKVVECADSAAFEENIRALAVEKTDLIIGGGWTAGDALAKMSTEMPDSAYALIDSEVDASGVKCISYREQEGAYLVGMIAASVVDGDGHTYGAVHCFEGPGSWKYRWGFMEGVKAIDPEATFIFNYTNSYGDPAKAKELAIQQYEQGCVFINAAAASGNSGVFEAAKEKGFYTSGVDVDQTDPSNPYIVSSILKDTYNTLALIVDEFFQGTYTTDNAVWGVSEGTIGAVNGTHDSANPRSDRLSDAEVAAVKAAAQAIISGKLDLTNPPDEEAYNASK